MFFSRAKSIVFVKSSGEDALTAYSTIFPKVQGFDMGVKASHVSFATAAAMIEDDEASLKRQIIEGT
jgi:hypothetical protein